MYSALPSCDERLVGVTSWDEVNTEVDMGQENLRLADHPRSVAPPLTHEGTLTIRS
jgi:hypothetical protein